MKSLKFKIEEYFQGKIEDIEVVKAFKQYYKNYLNNIEEILNIKTGKDFCIKHTKHTDLFLTLLYKFLLKKYFGTYQPLSGALPINLIALGSYGREQLCTYSDIDIMILYKNVKAYNLQDLISEFVTLAWDCGLKLGSRVHEINEILDTSKTDITIKSSFLESRLIYGSKNLWLSYEKILNNVRKDSQKKFVEDKLKEHKTRLYKNPLSMQIQIKEGYGGIRESNILFWISNIIYNVKNVKELSGIVFTEEEYKKYKKYMDFIYLTRAALHNISNKKQDLIHFDIIPALSLKLGYTDKTFYQKERIFLAKLTRSLHTVHFFTSIFTKKITRQIFFKKENISILRKNRYKKDIYIVNNKLYCSFFRKKIPLHILLAELTSLPDNINYFDESYIYFASKSFIGLNTIDEFKKNVTLFLKSKKLYLKINLLYNANQLSKVFPIFKNSVNLPQFDGYHEFPVDLHSIKTLYYCENIEDTLIKELFNNLNEPYKNLLKLVCLFHDIGKGKKDEHHIIGARLFKKLAKDINLENDLTKIGSKLIYYHSIMSYSARHEDVYSEKTILNFAGTVGNITFLKMLYILTYCDINAVGKYIYNSSTASLLKQLYFQTLPAFENQEVIKESSRRIAKINTIRKLKKFKTLSNMTKRKILYISSNQIFLILKAEDILDIALRALEVKTYIYKIINKKRLTIRIIRKSPLNLGYLLGKLEFLSISSTNIYKLYDNKKAFEINFNEKIEKEDILYVEKIIKDSFDMQKTAKLVIPNIRRKDIIINSNHTTYLAAMKLKTKDQKGLFAYIAKIFDDFNIEIESAKLLTLKGYARDLFLIEKNTNFWENKEKILDLICSQSS